jgi:tetratricopeptide (TPR) repeat protein
MSMTGFQKRLLTGAVASALWMGGAGLSAAQELLLSPSTGGLDVSSAPDAPQVDDAARLDALFAELAEPGRADYERIEGEIRRIWSKSGSPAMDLLLRRGEEAMEAEQFDVAVEHLSALTDHAPDFAEGWNARATAFFYLGEYSLSIADIERTLALNPRHFGALEGLAAMLEEMDQPAFALRALREAARINPNRPSVQEAMTRLERKTGAVEL